jgi:hypothetical protein
MKKMSVFLSIMILLFLPSCATQKQKDSFVLEALAINPFGGKPTLAKIKTEQNEKHYIVHKEFVFSVEDREYIVCNINTNDVTCTIVDLQTGEEITITKETQQ